MSARASLRPWVWALAALLAAPLGCGWKLETRPVPDASDAPDDDAGQRALAPEFSLPGDDGSFVSLADLLADGKPAVLVFYRGHW